MKLSTKSLLVVLIFLFVQKGLAQNCDATFFSTQANPRCAWNPVTFTPTGNAAAISSYDWDFGDGGFSFGDTVNHVFPFYPNDTCYNVTLTVRDTAGNLCSQSRSVCILASPEIVVNGIFNGCRRNLTDTATFTAWYVIDTQLTDMSLGPFRWDFGDGTPVVITSNDSVQHTFTQFGRYQLSVSVPGLPCAIFTQNIDFFTDPIANINILNGPTFCEGDTVCLANLSDPNKGPVDAFTWDFRDGTVVTVGDTATQKHVYDLTGTNPNYNGTSFQVQLTAQNTCYTHITTVQVTIEPKPRADFSWSPRIGCMPNPRIRFTNRTIPNSSLNRFFWDFGDPASGANNTSTSPSPFHTFTDTGLYTVTLIVENRANRCGDDTIQQIVEISMPPVAQAIASDSLGCGSLGVNYTNTSFPTRGLQSTWTVRSPPGGSSSFINGSDRNSYSPDIRFVGIGTHFVELEVRNACGRDFWRDTIEIAAIPAASIPVWPDSCGPVTIQPTVSLDSNNAPLGSIVWQFTGGTPASFSGLTPPPITFNAANNQVQVAITNRCGTRTVSSVFQLDSLPIVDAGPDVSLCPGDDTIRLGGTPFGGFWQSMTPVVDSQGNFFTTQTGSYDLTYTFIKTGCPPVSDSLLAFVDTLPLVQAPVPFSICVGGNPLPLSGGTPAGGSYSGNLPGLVQNDSLFPIQVGTFTVYYRYQDSISGCENIDSTLVTIDPLPVVDAGPDVQFCLTSVNQQLNGTPAGGTWTGPCVRANGTIVPNCLGTGTFTLFYTFTDGNGCTNLDSMQLTIVQPVIPQTMPDTVLCRNAGLLSLTATPAGGLWNNVPGLVPPATFDPLLANSGSNELVYIIQVGNSCEQTDTLMITILDTLVVDAGPADTACTNGGVVTLTGFSPAGGTWSGLGIIDPSGIFDPGALTAGRYQLRYQVTDSLTGCVSSDFKSMLVVDPPLVDAGADTTFCLVNMLQNLTPATPAGGTWSGTCMLPSGSVNPTCLGIGSHVAYYTFTDANGCTSVDSLAISVIAPTNALAMPDTALCRNAGVLGLSASPNGGVWSSASPGFLRPNAFDLLLGNSGPNEFVYTVFSGTSCEQSDTVIVTVLDTATLSMAGPDTACSNGASFVLGGYSPAGGTWSGPGVVDGVLGQIDPSTLTAGTYTLTYTYFNIDSCTSTGTSQLVIVDPPVVDAGADTTFCLTNAVQTLDPASPTAGIWSGACINATGQLNPSCLGVGNHVVYYSFTDQNGCTSTDSLIVTVAQPVVPQTMNDTAVCRNSAVLALRVDQTVGSWRSNSPGFIPPASFDPLPANSVDTFIYTIFPNTSCEQSDTLIITVQDTATLSMGGPDTACSNGIDFALGGFGPTGGFWSGPGVINASPGIVAPSTLAAGSYTLQYNFFNADSCLSTGFRQLVIVDPPVVDAGPDTTFCLTNNAQVLNPPSPTGGTWSGPCVVGNGQLSPACLGVGSHVLYYSFTDQNGCTSIDSLTVTVVLPVVPVAMNDTAVCRNSGLLALQVDQTNGAWSSNSPGFMPPASFDPFVGNPVDTFIYTIFPNTSCEQSDTVIITVIDTPVVNPGPTVIACTNDLNFFLAGYNPVGGTWSGPGIVNGTTGEINPRSLTAGNYTLTYSYTDPQTACTSTVQRTLSVFDPPNAMLTVPPLVCENDPVLFSTATPGVSSYFWDFGVTSLTNDTSSLANPVYVYTDTGTYTITLVVGNPQGCFDTTSASLYVNEPPRPSFTSTPDSACASYDIQPGVNGIAVNFTDTSVPANGSYSWDFGGGVDAFGQTGQVGAVTSTVYFAQGTRDTFYYPSLTISNSCDTVTFIDTILVKPVPVVRFGPDQDLGCSPFCPSWTNLTVGSPDVFEWSVDGVFWSNDSIPPARCFTYTGRTDTTFTIRLIASNACGADTADHVITVRPNTVDPFFNTDSIQGCPPLTVTFTSISSAPNRSFDLGDGTTTNQDTITHSYTQPGTYIVRHFVDNGCSYDTGFATITVFPIPDVRILPRDTVVCPDEIVQLRDSNFVGNSIAYVWDLGNGNTSIQTSPTVSYSQPGLYNVSVRAQTVANACPASDSTTIRVLPKPDVTFQLSDTIGCPPLDVQVSGLAAGAAGYAWDFGDGNSSVNRLPLHRYDSTGRYVMSLVVDDGFCQADTTVNIRVFPVPEAGFEAVQDSLCGISSQVSFLNNSTGTTSLGYRWQFGDGDSSVLAAPRHSYNQDGQFDVSLEVSNSFGCLDTAIQPVWIFPQPSASVQLSDSSGCGPLEIEIDNLTTNGTFTNVDLYLGDGAVDLDPRFPYRHTYNTGFNDTSYTAVLTVDYANGFCVDTISKQVEVYSRPVADITVSPDSLCGTPAPVSGQNLSTSSRTISQYTWNWGDGSAGSSTRNADHTYSQTGDFDISMIVENDAGCADTATAEVAVIPQAEADIVADPAFGCSELDVLFSLAQPNAATNAQWDFGDGSDGTGLTANHTYTDSGTFTVDLIVDYNGLCPDTGQATIEVDLPPIALFEASVSGFCIDSVVVSTLNLSQYADSVVWLFGDGRSSSEWEPEIIYAQPDDYVLTLIAYNAAFGCSDTFSEVITYRRTNALFDYVKDTICSPVTAMFTDMSTGATTWDWDFGFPRGRDTAQNPTFVYKEAGEYFVTLTITYNGECETSYTHPVPIKVAKTPKVSFFVSDPRSTDSVYLGFPTQIIYENEQLVQFLNESLFADGGYLWEFSEGPLPIRPVYSTGVRDPQYTFIFNSDRDTAVHFVRLTAYDTDSLCPVSDSMAFLLVADNSLWVPTGFTPNGDSHNETWQVFIDTEYGTPQFVEILVFDRWGNVVFQGDSPDSQWDGSYKGRAAPEGVYTWYVKAQFHTSRTVEKTGTVTLLR